MIEVKIYVSTLIIIVIAGLYIGYSLGKKSK